MTDSLDYANERLDILRLLDRAKTGRVVGGTPRADGAQPCPRCGVDLYPSEQLAHRKWRCKARA